MKKLAQCLGILPLFLAGCSTELAMQPDNTPTEDVVSSITVSINEFGGSSRTLIDPNDNFSMKWLANDAIGILPKEGQQIAFPLKEGSQSNWATFSGEGWALKANTSYIAYYPLVDKALVDRTQIPIDLTGQKQMANNSTDHLGKYDFLVSQYSDPVNGSVSFTLEHVLSLAHVSLYVPDKPEGYSQLVLSEFYPTSSPRIGVDGSVNLETGLLTQKTVMPFLKIDLANIHPENGKLDIYFMMMPFEYDDSQWRVLIDDLTFQLDGCIMEKGQHVLLDDNSITTPHTVTVSTTANGTVWINDNRSDNNIQIKSGKVTLHAEGHLGYEFKHWIDLSGNVVSTERDYVVYGYSHINLRAVFESSTQSAVSVETAEAVNSLFENATDEILSQVEEVEVKVGTEGQTVEVATITLPQAITASEQQKEVDLVFNALPVAAAADDAIVITDNQTADTALESKSEVLVAIPEATAQQQAPSFVINLPSSTVTLSPLDESAKYSKVIATTAENTLKVATGVTIEELVIRKGNVVVSGNVNSITAEENTIVYVIGNGSVGTIDPASPGQITMKYGSEFNAGNTGFVWE